MHLPSLPQLLHEPGWRRPWAWAWVAQILLVGFAALTPGDAAPTFSPSDKFDHLLAFCVLAATGVLALQHRRMSLLRVGAALLAYGGFIEIAQMQIPGRYGDWADLLADAVGVALGLGLTLTLRRFWPPISV